MGDYGSKLQGYYGIEKILDAKSWAFRHLIPLEVRREVLDVHQKSHNVPHQLGM